MLTCENVRFLLYLATNLGFPLFPSLIDTFMPVHSHFSLANTSIYVWEMTEDVKKLEELFYPSNRIPREVHTRQSVARQREQLCTRLLLQFAHISSSSLSYKESGAPYLTESEQCISISHSSAFVAVAISRHNIGIDLENPLRLRPQTVQRILQKQELSLLNEEHLAHLWTAKEAAFKAFADKGIQTLSDIYLTHSENHWTAHFKDAVANCHFTPLGGQLLCLAERP